MEQANDYPSLPPEEEGWRPRSANDVMLRDRDLAKLGLLAQLEAQCKSSISMSIKSLEGLSYEQWCALDLMQFRQLVDRLAGRAAAVDPELAALTQVVAEAHAAALKHRHQNLHSLWAWNPQLGGMMTIDPKRQEKLYATGLDDALAAVAQLTFHAKACVMRVGWLVTVGAITESVEDKGPRICVKDRWVKL